jgi:hypothetical protein
MKKMRNLKFEIQHVKEDFYGHLHGNDSESKKRIYYTVHNDVIWGVWPPSVDEIKGDTYNKLYKEIC